MALVPTAHGSLHYDVIDQVAPWSKPRGAILFHHGIGASAAIWAGWFPALADAHRLVTFDRRQLDANAVGGGVKAWSDAFMHDRFHDDALTPEQRKWFARQQEKWPRDSILNALGVLIGTDLSPRLKDIACPTLLLHPDGSPFIPVPIMADLHRLLPDAELNVIGHARHGLPYSHASRCASLLRTFLDSRAAG
jgi:pimeloyl-ACP methyl ester carboxylesterase